MALSQQIEALKDTIAQTEFDLAHLENVWDSYLVTYNEMTGEPYSAYVDQEDIYRLEAAINKWRCALRDEKQQLAALQVKQQQEAVEVK